MDSKSKRILDSFMYLNFHRFPNLQCQHVLYEDSNNGGDSLMELFVADELNATSVQYQNKELLCPDLSRQPLSEVDACNFDATIPNAIYTHKSLPATQLANILHAFVSVSDKFGRHGKLEDVFGLFNRFKNEANVIFSDEADRLVSTPSSIDEDLYHRIHCKKVVLYKVADV